MVADADAETPQPWACIVKIRSEVDAAGQKLKQVKEELFGPTISDKQDVEMRVRLAQKAVLNPSTYLPALFSCMHGVDGYI